MTVREPTGRTPHAIATPRAIVVLNDRRLCLLEQKYRRGACGGPGVGLTAEEQAELNECAAAMDEYMGRSGWREPSGGGPPCPTRTVR